MKKSEIVFAISALIVAITVVAMLATVLIMICMSDTTPLYFKLFAVAGYIALPTMIVSSEISKHNKKS
jgi:Flp pilus assembly protein TadB